MTTSQKISAMQNLRRTGNLEVPDSQNPDFLFQGISTELLSKVVKGEIDAQILAYKELRNRGLDSSGRWVGFGKKYP